MDNPALGEKSGMQHNGRAGAKGVFEVLQLLGYHWEQDVVAQWDQAKKKKKLFGFGTWRSNNPNLAIPRLSFYTFLNPHPSLAFL